MKRYISILFALIALFSHGEVFYFSTDSVKVPSGEITAVEVRAANNSSRIGEAKLSGWKIVWPGVDISLTFDFRNFVDGVSNIDAVLQVNSSKVTLKDNLNTNGEFNTVAIEWKSDGKASFLVGEHKLKETLTMPLAKPADSIAVSGIGGDVVIQDFIIETNSNAFDRLKRYTPEDLTDAKRWEYLDRTNDPTVAKVGGQYILAQIGNDLVYISGAQTNTTHWQAGMLKGELTPTGFDGYFKLAWYDATGRKMPGENFAELDNSLGVLKLTFSELGATIRLKLADQK